MDLITRLCLRLFYLSARWRAAGDLFLSRVSGVLLDQYHARRTAGRVRFRRFHWLREDSARWTSQPSSGHRLSIVVSAYKQPDALECLLASLRCQTLQNFDVLVFHDGPDAPSKAVAERYSATEPGKYRFIETAERYNDYGHTLRDMGIREATGEFVLLTNGDNYYPPRFVELAFEAIDIGKLDLAMWDMVHSHSHAGGSSTPVCYMFSVQPLRGFIDIGAFLVKTEIAQAVGFRSRTFSADADYFEDLVRQTTFPVRMGKVEKVLLVHN